MEERTFFKEKKKNDWSNILPEPNLNISVKSNAPISLVKKKLCLM